MDKVLFNVKEVAEKIAQGKSLLLAGDEELLKQLPAGQWIAGTIPYFMAEDGGVCSRERIFVTELPSYVTHIGIKRYGKNDIYNIYKEVSGNVFSIMIIPSSSPTHYSFALDAVKYEGFAANQLIGWIAGVNLNDLGKITPKVFFGPAKEMLDDGAVVMHVHLPDHKYAELNILNIFKQGSGDTILFPEDGFSAAEALINNEKQNLVDYIVTKNIDTKLPLVANYCGAMVNTSFQEVDKAAKRVTFYAPVFKGVEYKMAAPVADYVKSFNQQMPQNNKETIAFSCNCILNYLYSGLEGKQTGGVTGPITFGEIAYQLLNQTMAYIAIKDI